MVSMMVLTGCFVVAATVLGRRRRAGRSRGAHAGSADGGWYGGSSNGSDCHAGEAGGCDGGGD